MPFTKTVGHVDSQINSRSFLKGIKGTEKYNFPTTRDGKYLIRWTLQQSNGDGGNMSNFPEAVSRYRTSEINAFKSAFKTVEDITNVKFVYTGINYPYPVELVARIQNAPSPGSSGNSARTRVNSQNRYKDYFQEDANKYYGELRVSQGSSSVDYNERPSFFRDLQYREGSSGYETILHELLHNLGVKHTDDTNLFPGVSNGQSATAPGLYGLNNSVATVMSYRDTNVWNQRTGIDRPKLTPATKATNSGQVQTSNQGNLGFVKTPMALDVAVLQKLFGKNPSHNSSNNTYILPRSSDNDYGWKTIWDTGGTDTIAAPNTIEPVQIDLRNANLLNNSTAAAGTYSYILSGSQGGFTIAHDWNGTTFGLDSHGININQCVIENAKGGKGADNVFGNKMRNIIRGYEGNDYLRGLGGNDSIYGDSGLDIIEGGDGNDILVGGQGSDQVIGGSGNDLIYGAYINASFGQGLAGSTNSYFGADGNGEIDRLIGGPGNDRFYLYGNGRAAYNDRNSRSSGLNDYADIIDFQPGSDKIVLIGNSSAYRLSVEEGSTNLWLKNPGTGSNTPDELIARIRGNSGLSLSSNSFAYTSGDPSH